MKRDLTAEQLAQPVTVTLPLGAVLRLAEDEPNPFVDPVRAAGRYAILGDVLPKIGEEWQGGKYAGITVHDNVPMALILLPGDEKMEWKEAGAWAEKQGGELPSRFDSLVLFKNLKSEFEDEWYWTSEQYARDADYAWVQIFGYGNQDIGHKSDDYRCRAVRRVAI